MNWGITMVFSLSMQNSKIDELCGTSTPSAIFEDKIREFEVTNSSFTFLEYKNILKSECNNGDLNYFFIEKRLNELMQMDVATLNNLIDDNISTNYFKTQEDLNYYMGGNYPYQSRKGLVVKSETNYDIKRKKDRIIKDKKALIEYSNSYTILDISNEFLLIKEFDIVIQIKDIEKIDVTYRFIGNPKFTITTIDNKISFSSIESKALEEILNGLKDQKINSLFKPKQSISIGNGGNEGVDIPITDIEEEPTIITINNKNKLDDMDIISDDEEETNEINIFIDGEDDDGEKSNMNIN